MFSCELVWFNWILVFEERLFITIKIDNYDMKCTLSLQNCICCYVEILIRKKSENSKLFSLIKAHLPVQPTIVLCMAWERESCFRLWGVWDYGCCFLLRTFVPPEVPNTSHMSLWKSKFGSPMRNIVLFLKLVRSMAMNYQTGKWTAT